MSHRRRRGPAAAVSLALVVALGAAGCGSDDEPATAAELPDLCDVVTTTPLPGWTFTVDASDTGGDEGSRTSTCSMSDGEGSTLTVSASSYGDDGADSADERAAAAYDDACNRLADSQGTPQRDDRTCELEPEGLPAGQAAARGAFNLEFLPGVGSAEVTTTEAHADDALTLVKQVRLSLVSELG